MGEKLRLGLRAVAKVVHGAVMKRLPLRLGSPSQAAWLPVAFLGAFFVAPVVVMLWRSVWLPGFSLEKYQVAFTDSTFVHGLWNSLYLAIYTMVATTAVGLFLVYGMDRWGAIWRSIISLGLVIPLITSGELVRDLAWIIGFSPTGPITRILRMAGLVAPGDGLSPSFAAVVVGLVHILLPFFVFVVYSTTRGMDKRVEQAAKLMGANRLQALLFVVVPAVAPGVFAGMLLVFMMSLGYYATPALLGTPSDTVLPVMIGDQIKQLGDFGQAAALGVLLLVPVLLLMVLLDRLGVMSSLYGGTGRARGVTPSSSLARSWTAAIAARPVQRSTEVLAESRAVRCIAGAAGRTVASFVLIFLSVPLVLSLGASFTDGDFLAFPPQGISLRWYSAFFGDGQWVSSALNSVAIALISAAVSVVIGACAGLALVRGKFSGKGILFVTVLAPLVIPWIVPALGLYFEMVKLDLAYSYAGISIGHVVMALPYTAMVLSTALARFDWKLDDAARMSGAPLARRLRDIYFPALRPAVVSAFLFAFLISFTEFVYAYFMTDVSLKTLPVKMWEGLTYSVVPTVAAAGGVITGLTLIGAFVLGLVQLFGRKRRIA